MALSSLLTLGALAYKYASADKTFAATGTAYPKPDMGRLAADYFWLGVMFLFCCGVAAAAGGLLRHHYLAWLCRRVRSRNGLLWGTLLGFEASAVLAAVVYWWATGAWATGQPGLALGQALVACFVISAPWLLAETWSARRLAAELRMPAHAPSPTVV